MAAVARVVGPRLSLSSATAIGSPTDTSLSGPPGERPGYPSKGNLDRQMDNGVTYLDIVFSETTSGEIVAKPVGLPACIP